MRRILSCLGLVMMISISGHAAEKAAVQSAGDENPPTSLLQEANGKAEAVILANIQSIKMPRGGFAVTTVKIKKVYRGPLAAGATLTYFSFREEKAAYPKAWLDHGVIVFLVSKESAGKKQWGESSEFFEFEYSPAIEKRIISLMQKK